MAEVILKNITKSFAGHRALDDVSMIVPDGSFVVLLGPTGAGKTTTLRMVSGLDNPDVGEVMIGGKTIEQCALVNARLVADVHAAVLACPHSSTGAIACENDHRTRVRRLSHQSAMRLRGSPRQR